MTLLNIETGRQAAVMASLEERMHRARLLAKRLQAMCDSGQLKADLHFNTGQEAIPVGVCAALKDTDYVLSHHRMIAWALSKGIPMRALVAELLGREDGLCGGLAGEMHMGAMTYRFVQTFQLVATVLPVAAGVAWAVKNYKQSDSIVVAVFGDAATANGQFHEGVNLAAVQQVPLLLVCENNRLAGNVRPAHYMPVEHVIQRAAGYGIMAARVDGNDLEIVVREARRAVNYVREYSSPFLLECDTTRLGKHKQGMGDIRSKEEMEEVSKRDPLLRTSVGRERIQEMDSEIATLLKELTESREQGEGNG